MRRLAIIVIAAVGLYAIVSSMSGPEEEISAMPKAPAKVSAEMEKSKAEMRDKKDEMETLTRAQETEQLLAELRTLPVSKFAENLSRYERLLELHPGNETFAHKVNFYSEKLRNKQASY